MPSRQGLTHGRIVYPSGALMHLRNLILAALLCVACSGCMETMVKDGSKEIPITETFKSLDRRLSATVGRPVSSLISTLGIPTDEKTIAGNRVVIWTLDRLVAVGNIIMPGKCNVRAMVNDKQEIVKADADGNNGGCSIMLERFKD